MPTALVAVHAARYREWIVDDAGITFAYARSLASGAGPVLQRGADPVEGFSNPAWTAILVVGRWLRLFDSGTWFGVPDVVAFPKLIALLCCFGIFWCFHSIAAVVVPRFAFHVTVTAGAIVAAVPSFVIWTMSGLENSLLAFAVVAIAAMLVTAARADRLLDLRPALMCGALAALAALTRPDGIVYAAAFPIAVLLVHREGSRHRTSVVVASFAAALGPVAIYEVWRLATYGSWLPNPAYAKQQGVPKIGDLNRPTEVFAYLGWIGAAIVVAAIVAGLRRSSTRSAVTALLIPLALAILSFAVLAPDWMAQLRFSTPIWPLVALMAALVIADTVPRFDLRARVGTTVLLGLAAMVTLDGWYVRSDAFLDRPTVGVCAIARTTGYTFNTYADRLGIDEGTLLAVDGGGTSLTTRLRFVDLSGLADERIARYWADDDMAGLRDHVFEEVRPTFIRIWFGWDGVAPSGILADERLARDYALVWGPLEGGGNWVRRDAVPDRTKLAALQRSGQELADIVDAPWWKGGMSWWCEDLLRPSAPGADPLTKIPT